MAHLVLLDRTLTVADTLLASGVAPTATVTQLRFRSDGTAVDVMLHSDSGGALARVQRATGTVLFHRTFPGDSLVGFWVLPRGSVPVTASGPNIQFLTADLTETFRRISVCDSQITAFTPFGVRDRAYAACSNDVIAEVDTELGIPMRSAPLSRGDSPDGERCGPVSVSASPNGTIIYVLCRDGGALRYLDRRTLAPFQSVTVGEGTRDLALTPDGHRALIVRPDSNDVIVVDLRRQSVEHRISIEGVQAAAVGMDGHFAYCGTTDTRGGGRVCRIDLETGVIVAEHILRSEVGAIAVWPDQRTPRMWWAP